MQPLLRDSVLAVLAGQLPDDEGLVPGAGQDHVGVLGVGRDLGHPSALCLQSEFIRILFTTVFTANSPIVAPEGTTKLQSLGHCLLLQFLISLKDQNLILHDSKAECNNFPSEYLNLSRGVSYLNF